jgi:hypothetical protein
MKTSEKRLSQRIGLSFPYDWSNRNMPPDLLIAKVLERGIFLDIAKVSIYYGIEQVRAVAQALPDDVKQRHRFWRSLDNIEKGIQFFFGKPHLDRSDTRTSFCVMGVEGILAMKAFVITQRVKSRDLFDLMTLVSSGTPIESIYAEAKSADPAINDGMITDVLTGRIPLDKDDEGLDAVDVEVTVEEIFKFFVDQIDQMEVRAVQRLLDMHGSGKGPVSK